MVFEKSSFYPFQFRNFDKNKGCACYFVEIYYVEKIISIDKYSLDSS